MRSVLTRTLYDRRWFMFGWFLGFAFLALLMVVFFPAMKQDGSLDALLEQMPAALQGFVGDLANLREFSTYLAAQMFDIRMQLLTGVMAIILGIGLSAGEEESGVTRTYLSLPISRTKLLVQKWLAMLVIIAVAVSGAGVGVLAMQGFVDESIDIGVLAQLLMMTWFVTVAMASITFAVAKATGVRSLAMLVGILVVAGSFIVSTFSAGVDWLKDFEFLSIFYYCPAVDIAKNGVEVRDVIVLLAVTLVALAVAWVLFRRRDVH